ncbi:gliding motility-associated C-terminal domain-containing protein [Daejeonella sp. H1SJ63]|uniref:T9SS type B sorting domain-containing protein n=1 Tax=Daejeonella sp. H1SJ63 TaxID=3034145 RepID=UPI0023EC2F5F|nr:gliding motility-associated C-terminal domain-containing protein [Daejeonella sp. H1SJ63]
MKQKNKIGIIQPGLRAMLFLFLFLPQMIFAQTVNQVYIFPSANMYAHPNSNLNIYSDISHSGTLVSYNSAIINFYAGVWQNNSGSRLPDESARGIDGIGGVFVFSDLRQNAQRINSVNSVPFNGFPNVRLDNALNVTADMGDLHVNNNLDFLNGHLILNNVNLTVGRAGTGTITGYSQTNFVVTGPGMSGGNLVRHLTGNTTAMEFPVGTAIGSYTPISINYTGSIPQTLKFRVADNVYNKLNFPEYVYKTWIMTTTSPDASAKVDITLQHNSAEEGNTYFRNRSESYISRYDPNLTGLWDIMPPMTTNTPGSITKRAAIFGAYMNTRLNVGSIKPVEYFSKSVIKKDIDENTPVNIPDAISPNGDGLNDTYIITKRLPTDIVRFEVYSRNQVLVYQDFNYLNNFDGTGNKGGFLGNTLPDGIYYYLISVNGAKGIPGYLVINR